MVENYYIGAYWSGRPEPLESYARRASVFLRQLAALDPTLIPWFEQASSPAAALRSQFSPDTQTLLGLFNKQKYRRGAGDVSFAAWNGESEASSVVSFSCGSPSPFVVDRCILTPPLKGQAAERLISASMMAQVLRAMALAWEPEWSVATSDAHRDMVSDEAAPGTFVGWVMYFANSRGALPPLPSPVRTEPVADRGTLVILTPERFTATNPEHVALAAQVQDLLAEAGLLRPLSTRANSG
jgi:hypothetical protein